MLRQAGGPHGDVEARLIAARPGYALGPLAADLVHVWRAEAPQLPGAALALALDSAAAVHAAAAARASDVVISGPASDAVAVRRTSEVVAELVRESTRSLLIVSFAAYRVPEVVAELIHAADRGVRIDLVLETLAEDGGALRGQHEPATAFAGLGSRAAFWTWPAQRRSAAGGSRAALHAKLLVVDARTAFVGSANLTGRGLADNIEAGVVGRITRHFAALMRPAEGVLERQP